MLLSHNPRTNRIAGFALLVLGALGLISSSWLKHSLHLQEGHAANSVDFVCGLAAGLGITFFFASLSQEPPAADSD